MTGADHFAQLLHQAEMVAAGAPEGHRAAVMSSMLQGGALGLAARLFGANDYAAGHDVVMLATQTIVQLAPEIAKDPAVADSMKRMIARMNGADVPLMAADEPPQQPTPGNALSAAELADLGLEPEPSTLADVKLAVSSEDFGDPEQYQFHERARSSTYEPLDFRCAREGADGLACDVTGAWHVNISTMKCGPIVRFLCAEHCRREAAWAYPEDEYVMHEGVHHIQFNRRRKAKPTP